MRFLAEWAVGEALADARLTPSDIQTMFFATAVEGIMTSQEMIRGQAALRQTGLLSIPVINVETRAPPERRPSARRARRSRRSCSGDGTPADVRLHPAPGDATGRHGAPPAGQRHDGMRG